MSIINNIDLTDQVSTTGVTELNENFNNLNNDKLEKIDTYGQLVDLEPEDEFIVYRPSTNTHYKTTLDDIAIGTGGSTSPTFPVQPTGQINALTIFHFNYNHASTKIVYHTANPGHLFMTKDTTDSLDGSLLIDLGSQISEPAYSPDDANIVYRGTDNTLFIKNSTDNSTGVSITTGICTRPVYSPDGLYIIYRAQSSGNVLFRKEVGSAGNGISFSTSEADYPVYKPDGNQITYINKSQGSKLYEKTAGGSDDGIAITSSHINCLSPDYSPDGTKIIYIYAGNLYRKNSGELGDGILIQSSTGNFCKYSKGGNYITYAGTDGFLYTIDTPA